MLFNNWFPTSAEYNKITTLYGENVTNWIHKRFKNFYTLYDDVTFPDLFWSQIMECHMELLKLKNIWDNNEPLTLGTKTTIVGTGNSTNQSNNTNSYKGYNVEGEFAKNTSNASLTNNTNQTNTSANLLDEHIKLTMADFGEITNHIYKKLINLFIVVL